MTATTTARNWTTTNAQTALMQALLQGTARLTEMVQEYLPEATTLTINARTGAPVAISETGYLAWRAGEDSILAPTLLHRIEQTAGNLLGLSSKRTTYIDAGWRPTIDRRFVIELG
ncbi:hypothetical protein [Streptomyces sp. DH12]|uniref:hypothetical protein n=1 Tax=Streptomyces sp. DH12 TaxID=2857010 RepID=UPI001E39722C|nr:hypothetical protein [Streptomyces sp. DH12]